jgi:mevalonate kinase
MSESPIDVNVFYINQLENTVSTLTKDKLILLTNVDISNKMIEDRDRKISELAKFNFENNEAIGNIQNNHQNETQKLEYEYNEKIARLYNIINEKQAVIDELSVTKKQLHDLSEKYNDLNEKYNITINSIVHPSPPSKKLSKTK